MRAKPEFGVMNHGSWLLKVTVTDQVPMGERQAAVHVQLAGWQAATVDLQVTAIHVPTGQ